MDTSFVSFVEPITILWQSTNNEIVENRKKDAKSSRSRLLVLYFVIVCLQKSIRSILCPHFYFVSVRHFRLASLENAFNSYKYVEFFYFITN